MMTIFRAGIKIFQCFGLSGIEFIFFCARSKIQIGKIIIALNDPDHYYSEPIRFFLPFQNRFTEKKTSTDALFLV